MVYHKITYIGHLKQHKNKKKITINYNSELCQLLMKHDVFIMIL
jgi:hypothetical protein